MNNIEKIASMIEAKVGEKIELVEQICHKNNRSYEAVIFKTVDIQAGPCIPVKDIPEDEAEFEAFANSIANAIAESSEALKKLDELRDFSKAVPKLRLCAISVTNEDFLKGVPHYVVNDLAFYARLFVSFNESAVVRRSLLQSWDVAEEEFWEICRKNTVAHTSRRHILDVIREMVPVFVDEDDIPMYVLRTDDGFYGAGAIACLSEIVPGEEWYVIPSSIHEAILVKDCVPTGLLEMVKEVNATEVLPEDRLADSVYYWNGEVLSRIQDDEDTEVECYGF